MTGQQYAHAIETIGLRAIDPEVDKLSHRAVIVVGSIDVNGETASVNGRDGRLRCRVDLDLPISRIASDLCSVLSGG